MNLTELTTPYERRRVIEYGSNGNSTVRHWRMVRQVAGPLYMTEPVADEWGDLRYNLYIFYPDIPDGGIYSRDMNQPEYYEPEKLLQGLKEMDAETPAGFIRMANRTMEARNFIGNAVIEFVRQWNPEQADVYAKYREDFYARKREQERVEREQREAEEAAVKADEKRRRDQEEATARALYLGWADAFAPMRFWKIHKAMEALIRTDGVVRTKRDFVIAFVKNGFAPEQKDGVTSWYKRYGEWQESKPRTEYYLSGPEFGYKLSKTEFEFAKYIQGHLSTLQEERYRGA